MSTVSLLLWTALLVGIVLVLGWLRLKSPPRRRLSPSVTGINGREANAWLGGDQPGSKEAKRWYRLLVAMLLAGVAIAAWQCASS